MTRQLYELNHPLYPHQDLIKYFNEHKIAYQPYQGSYDDAYRNWYQLVRADHDLSGAAIRPIYREISQIIRLRSSGKEFIKYSENLWGLDHEHNPIPFFHTYGEYTKPAFKKTYNYDTNEAHTIRSGAVDTVYFIEYSPKLIDELYAAGPDNMDIELLVNVGSKQYGGRGFFTYDEYRDMSIEQLGRIGNEGKGMFTTTTVNIPQGTMASELKSLNNPSGTSTPQQQKLWQEFLEFQKFRQGNLQVPNPPTTTTTVTDPNPSRIKVKAANEK